MSILLPPVPILPLKVPLRASAANLFNPANQRPASILAQFDWAGDYFAGNANPDVNVLCSMQGGGNTLNSIDIIRSVKIDNTGNPFPVYVYFIDTTDTIVAPPNTVVWEPVVTNARTANVILLGATDNVGLTKVYFCNFFVPPYINAEIAQAVDLRLASPQIVFGGLSLGAGQIVASGQSYTGGALAISGGGGGSGAAAHGILDAFGRFTGVVIDTPGANYRGPVTLTATASHAARANWTGSSGTNYGTGNIVSYGGTEWIRSGGFIYGQGSAPAWVGGENAGAQVSRGGNNYTALVNTQGAPPPSFQWALSNPAPPPSDGGWTNSGGAGGRTAVFSVTMNAGAGEIILNPTYAPPALGDQIQQSSYTLSNTLLAVDNLFGSPYPAGFIYLTSENMYAYANAGATILIIWELVSLDGIVIDTYDWNVQAISAFVPILLRTNSGMNVKLDATKQWRLLATALPGSGASVSINHRWTYTYSLK